ncbi:hypothetical protein CALCODRAFT_416641, partial [Calocera cornea HHB12733]
MWTGNWWHRMQGQLPPGATLIPYIIATDKTQLTQFTGNRQGYPIYMTIGNLPITVRRTISTRAYVLIGYLPTDSFDGLGLSEEACKVARQRLFHCCMRKLLDETRIPGYQGVELSSGDGTVRLCYPILAGWMGDYPEQCLVTCTRYLRCP